MVLQVYACAAESLMRENTCENEYYSVVLKYTYKRVLKTAAKYNAIALHKILDRLLK
jgi:hypothetical protein